MLIDIHNHVITGLDDGAKTNEESLQMLKKAANNNIKKLIVTPHFKEQKYENTRDIICNRLDELKKLVNENNIDIELYPGSEIFLTKKTNNLLNSGEIQTLNNTKYILVEMFPLAKYRLYDFKEELYNLKVDGYKVILAHPERYDFTHDDPNTIYDLVDEGYYIQVNVNCLNSHHPNFKTVRKLLDHNLVQFVASDAHSYNSRPLDLQKGYDYIIDNYGKDYADLLFYENPLNIIENKEVRLGDYRKIKKKKFFFI